MRADVHDGLQRPPKVVKGDAEIVLVGAEFLEGYAGESLKALERLFNIREPGLKNVFIERHVMHGYISLTKQHRNTPAQA